MYRVLLFCLALASAVPALPASAAEPLVALPPIDRRAPPDGPMIFPRIRTIYNLYRNNYQNFYATNWIDRPLFHDSSLYDLPEDRRQRENDVIQFNIAADYGVTGLSMLYHNSAHFKRFQSLMDAAESSRNPGEKVFISMLGYLLKKGPEQAADIFEPVLRRMLASPAAARIGGKLVVGSYGTDCVPPETLGKFLDIMRKRCGDRFYFVAAIASLKGGELSGYAKFRSAFEAGDGRLPASEVEAAKAYLRSYLNVCDGILMNDCNHVDTVNDQFARKFHEEFICRLFDSVLAEPGNEKKLLGLSASLGYINHITGSTQFENGTRTLRESLAAAYAAHPDFIIMPEWNELNENTCLEPTVARSRSTARIVRHRTKGSGALPNDPTDLPDLIVSARAVLKGGDNYFLELLNVPDSGKPEPYTVSGELVDENGGTIKRFPPVAMDPEKLDEKRFTLSAKELSCHLTVKPRLKIRLADSGKEFDLGDGLPVTRYRSSWNTNRICSKQPVRDLAELKKLKIGFRPLGGDEAGFEVAVESGRDKLRNVEILADETVLYSHDRTGRLNPGENEALLHLFYSSIHQITPFPIKIGVTGGTIRRFQDRLRMGDSREDRWENGAELEMSWKSNQNRRGAIFIVTNPDKAVIHVTTPQFQKEFKVSDIIRRGIILDTSHGTIGLGIEQAARALDVPPPIDRNEVAFSTRVKLPGTDAVCFVRIITMSGKSFLAGPYLTPHKPEELTVPLTVFPDSGERVLSLWQRPSQVVDLTYSAANRNGAIVKSGGNASWDATMGGGIEYGGVFSTPRNYAAKFKSMSPAIVEDGGIPVFEFNGDGNYLHFPPEVIPGSSAFTLEFECKPFDLNDQNLFTCRGEYEGMLDVDLVGGKVRCIFRGQLKKGERPYYKTAAVTSPDCLKANAWNRIRVVYDLKEIRLDVNGVEATPVPFSRPGWWPFRPSAFGGWGTKGYFHGRLKYLKVKHVAVTAGKSSPPGETADTVAP